MLTQSNESYAGSAPIARCGDPTSIDIQVEYDAIAFDIGGLVSGSAPEVAHVAAEGPLKVVVDAGHGEVLFYMAVLIGHGSVRFRNWLALMLVRRWRAPLGQITSSAVIIASRPRPKVRARSL